MGKFKGLESLGSDSHIESQEDIDMIFLDLEARNQRIDTKLDFEIRMSIRKVKLQFYYESKLKEFRQNVTNSIPKEKPKEKVKANPSTPIIESEKTKKKRTKAEKKKVKEEIRKLSMKSKATKKLSVRFSTYRAIDAIVNYFKENNNDLNAVTENWVRQKIYGVELLEYYKNRMQLEVKSYRSVVYRMLHMSRSADKERRQLRIEKFEKDIVAFIESRRVEKQGKRVSKENGESSFDYLKQKEWILDWNCVMFKRGSVVIYARSDLSVKFKPTTVYVKDSIESFNYLKKYLNERLPQVRCLIVGQSLTVIDEINFNSAIQQFSIAARQGVIKTSGRGVNLSVGPMPMSFSQAMSKAKQMTPEEFHKYKSEYIDFLVIQQGKNYKVIPCVERLAHSNSDITEAAFMFSIECKSSKVLVVYENVNPDRSTLLFMVEEEVFDKSIREIYNFLQSPVINKRSSLRDRSVEIGHNGIVSYRSINHDDLYSWKSTIAYYKNYR